MSLTTAEKRTAVFNALARLHRDEVMELLLCLRWSASAMAETIMTVARDNEIEELYGDYVANTFDQTQANKDENDYMERQR